MNRLIFLASLAVLTGCVSPVDVTPTRATPVTRTTSAPPAVSPAPTPTPWVRESTLPPPAPVTSTPRSGVAGSLRNRTIVVDAGHGGSDPGARALSPTDEKHITLAIARELQRLLEQAGARVVMTRTGDSYPTLEQRAALAKANNAHLLVSIHADSAENASAAGLAVWHARKAREESLQAARSIDAAARREGLNVRGLRQADFKVLVLHPRPAVLVECGFLTNAEDARALNRPDHRSRIARAIANGVLTALGS